MQISYCTRHSNIASWEVSMCLMGTSSIILIKYKWFNVMAHFLCQVIYNIYIYMYIYILDYICRDVVWHWCFARNLDFSVGHSEHKQLTCCHYRRVNSTIWYGLPKKRSLKHVWRTAPPYHVFILQVVHAELPPEQLGGDQHHLCGAFQDLPGISVRGFHSHGGTPI